jgi:hypothetical protein
MISAIWRYFASFLHKKSSSFLCQIKIKSVLLQRKKNIRGAEACAKAEKIPIEPDAGNAVGGKKYEN